MYNKNDYQSVLCKELLSKMESVCVIRGFTPAEAHDIAYTYWDAELRGKTTHGVEKFCVEAGHLLERKKRPEIIVDKKASLLVNGNKEVGPLAAKFCTRLAIKRARLYGVAIVGLSNVQRYGVLDTWSRIIAEHNLIGLVMNTCEPAAAPYGGISPLLGTNPVSIAIPTMSTPLVSDMATSKMSMSAMWKARREHTKLPPFTFLTKTGSYTKDPMKVHAVEIFGGYKGFALSLMVEILAGALIRAKMTSKIHSFYDIGYFFEAIDPSIFQPLREFKIQVSNMLREVKKSGKKRDVKKIIFPGEQGEERKRNLLLKKRIDVRKDTLEHLFALLK